MNRDSRSFVLLVILAVGSGSSSVLRAGFVDLPFELVPWTTRVDATGGFAGIHWPLTATGELSLRFDFDPRIPLLPLDVSFVDVRGILFDPRIAAPLPIPGWDLDQTLNLTELDGQVLSLRRFQFTGHEGQDQPIQLKARLRNGELHVIGRNSPGCCDFFQYDVNLVARFDPTNASPPAIDFWNSWKEDRDEAGLNQVVPEPGAIPMLLMALLFRRRHAR